MYLNMRKMENPDVNITVAQWIAKQDKDPTPQLRERDPTTEYHIKEPQLT